MCLPLALALKTHCTPAHVVAFLVRSLAKCFDLVERFDGHSRATYLAIQIN